MGASPEYRHSILGFSFGAYNEDQRVRTKLPWIDPHLPELLALAVFAAFGCGLALAEGHFLFVGIFAAVRQ